MRDPATRPSAGGFGDSFYYAAVDPGPTHTVAARQTRAAVRVGGASTARGLARYACGCAENRATLAGVGAPRLIAIVEDGLKAVRMARDEARRELYLRAVRAAPAPTAT